MEDWDDLKVVLAIARAGALSGAAKRLGVNHATVSRRLSALERRLGARLFDRLPNGVAPTEAGRAAAEAAEAMERSALQLDRTLNQRDKRLAGPLTLTAPLLFLMGVGAEMLRALREAHPALELTVLASNETLNLHRREADIAIRWTDAPDESLFGVRMTPQRAAAYGAPGYLERLGDAPSAAPEDVEIDWLGLDSQTEPPTAVRERHPRARMSLRSNDKLAAAAAARAGLGLCYLPCQYGDAQPDLIRAPGLPLRRYRDLWLLTHPDLWEVERIRAAMRALAAEARRRRSRFMGGEDGAAALDAAALDAAAEGAATAPACPAPARDA